MNYDLLATAIFIIFGAVMAFQSIHFGLGRVGDPGPGFLPFVSSVCIGFLSLGHLISQIRKRGKEKKLEFHFGPSWKKAFFLMAISFLYVGVLWDRLGYLLSTTLWLASIFRIGGFKSWKKNLVMTVVIVLTSYLLFEKIGQCYLPKGILRF